MPSSIRSCAAVFAHPQRPARAVFDVARSGMGCFTELDAMRQIRPQPAARMCGRASRTSRTDVRRFASIAAWSVASSTSSARPFGGPPAFPTRMCSAPNRSTVASTNRRGASGSVTSAGEREHLGAQLGRGRAKRFRISRVDRDRRALVHQRLRRCATEPLRRRRDERHLACESEVHGVRCYAPARCHRESPPTRRLPSSCWCRSCAGGCAATDAEHGPTRTTPRASALGTARGLRDRGELSGRRRGLERERRSRAPLARPAKTSGCGSSSRSSTTTGT